MSEERRDRTSWGEPTSRRNVLRALVSLPLLALLTKVTPAEARPAVDPPNIVPGLSDKEIKAGLRERYGIEEFTSSVSDQIWTPEKFAIVDSILGILPVQILPNKPNLTLCLANESGVFEGFYQEGPPTQVDINHRVMTGETEMNRAARVDLLQGLLIVLDPINPDTYNAKGEPKNPLHADSPWIREALGIFGGKYGSAPDAIRIAAQNPQRPADRRWITDPVNPEGFLGNPELLIDIAANSGRYPRELTATTAVLRMHLGRDGFLATMGRIFPGKEDAIETFITGTVLQGQDYSRFQPIAA